MLLCDPAATPARPLLALLLLEPAPSLQGFWRRAGFDQLTLADIVHGELRQAALRQLEGLLLAR